MLDPLGEDMVDTRPKAGRLSARTEMHLGNIATYTSSALRSSQIAKLVSATWFGSTRSIVCCIFRNARYFASQFESSLLLGPGPSMSVIDPQCRSPSTSV